MEKPKTQEEINENPASQAPEADFKAYLLGGPKVDDFSIERDLEEGRDVEFGE